MTLITSEVYDYMLDDIQRSTMRSVSKMNDVVEHLKLQADHDGRLAQYVQKAEGVQVLLRQVATQIDELPALGADLEALVNGKEAETGAVERISEAKAIELVGQRMTRAAVEKALLESYDAEAVQYDVMNTEYIIFHKEEESK